MRELWPPPVKQKSQHLCVDLCELLKATMGFLKWVGLHLEKSSIKCILYAHWQNDAEIMKDNNALPLESPPHQ